jgi:ATPase family associated with various cellular activities (AAA)
VNLPTGDARDLARALTELLDAGRQTLAATGSPLTARIAEHVGCSLDEIPNVAEHLPSWDHANLQRGVDAYLARYSPGAAWFGIAGHRHFTSIVDMLAMADARGEYRQGAVDYTTVATGPATAAEAVQLGLVCTVAPDGSPVVLGLQGAQEDHGEDRCHLQILAASRTTAAAVREELLRLTRAHDVFRGQVLSFGMSEHRGNRLLTFLPRPELRADQVVLADGVLASIERHVVRSAAQTEALRERGQHLKRGLLLYGPPGTGKTHTVRYLLSRLPGCTVFVLSGVAMIRWLRATASLARRLEPSVVVVEDVDLIAEDRSTRGREVPGAPAAPVRRSHAAPGGRIRAGQGHGWGDSVVREGVGAPRGAGVGGPGRPPRRADPAGRAGRAAVPATGPDQEHAGRPLIAVGCALVILVRFVPRGIPPRRKLAG